MALPVDARTRANQLLQQLELQAQHTAAPSQRCLRLQPLFQAASLALMQEYRATAQSHVLAHSLLPAQHYRPQFIPPSNAMNLDTAMVHRWLAPWLAEEIA